MRKTEVQHNSAEQVVGYLADALVVVNDLDPPDDLRQACFVKAVDLLSAKQVFFESAPAIPDGLLRGPH